MSVKLPILLLIACSLNASFGASIDTNFNERIVGGELAEIEEFPYIVSLAYDNSGTGEYKHRCGGSILNKKTILTAAHCVHSSSNRWKIRVGSKRQNASGEVLDFDSYKIHDNYVSSKMDYDFALMFPLQEIVLDGKTKAPIVLPEQDEIVPDNSQALAIGWGSTYSGGSIQEYLRKVLLPIVNQTTCFDIFPDRLTDRMICAGDIENGGIDACLGDSGGPLQINGTVVGLTSWGRSCAKPGYPGVWSRVPAVSDWIKNNTRY